MRQAYRYGLLRPDPDATKSSPPQGELVEKDLDLVDAINGKYERKRAGEHVLVVTHLGTAENPLIRQPGRMDGAALTRASLAFDRPGEPCKPCKGLGSRPWGGSAVKCGDCDGTGRRPERQAA